MTQHDAELPFEFLVGEFRDRLDPGDADDIDDAVYHAQLHLGGFQHLGDAGGAGHVRSAMMATHRLRNRARLVLHDIDAEDAGAALRQAMRNLRTDAVAGTQNDESAVVERQPDRKSTRLNYRH